MALVVQVIPIKIDPLLDAKKVEAALKKEMDAIGKEMAGAFSATTRSWTGSKPTMGTETDMSAGTVWAGPQGNRGDEPVEKWIGLDDGIPAHDITPRNAPYLRFRWQGRGASYVAGTWRHSFQSGPHYKLGPYRRFLGVQHPGIRVPRDWTGHMITVKVPEFTTRLQAAIDGSVD